MRRLRYERPAQTFAGVNERIHEHNSSMQDREVTQCVPRIIGATELKIIGVRTMLNIWRPIVSLTHAASERRGRRRKRTAPPANVTAQANFVAENAGSAPPAAAAPMRMESPPRPAISACIVPKNTFSIASHKFSIAKSQQTVFNFAGELKFRNQRHRNRPNAGKHHADRHDPR